MVYPYKNYLFYFRVLRNNRTKIHINLFTAILIQVIIRLIIYVDELAEKNEANGINVVSSFTVSLPTAVFRDKTKQKNRQFFTILLARLMPIFVCHIAILIIVNVHVDVDRRCLLECFAHVFNI
jgi:hypothetical protein